MDITIRTIQTALFTTSLDLTNKINLSSLFLKGTKNLFDGEPIILPLPNDAPPEIPRIILKNKTQFYTLQISTNRVDFIYEDKSADDKKSKAQDLTKEYSTNLSNVLKTLISNIGSKIIRIGFIPVLQSKLDDSANYVVKTYLKDTKLTKGIAAINFRILHKTIINDLSTNIWLRVNSFNKPGDKLDNKIVTFLFDVNTPQEITLDLKQKDILKYIAESLKHILDNIDFYTK
jgi:hypothetical protein